MWLVSLISYHFVQLILPCVQTWIVYRNPKPHHGLTLQIQLPIYPTPMGPIRKAEYHLLLPRMFHLQEGLLGVHAHLGLHQIGAHAHPGLHQIGPHPRQKRDILSSGSNGK